MVKGTGSHICICSSPKEEGELPSEWFDTEAEAWEYFNWLIRGKKIRWWVKPEVIEHQNKFNITGWRKL